MEAMVSLKMLGMHTLYSVKYGYKLKSQRGRLPSFTSAFLPFIRSPLPRA